jgi:hypothetical protein
MGKIVCKCGADEQDSPGIGDYGFVIRISAGGHIIPAFPEPSKKSAPDGGLS